MKKINSIISIVCITTCICFSEPSNLIQLDLIHLENGMILFGYEKNIKGRHNAETKLELFVNKSQGVHDFSMFFGYSYYTNDSIPFKGWWLLPQVGARYILSDPAYFVTTAGIGYSWELPLHLSIGFNLGPGVEIPLTKSRPFKKAKLAAFGIINLGFKW